MKAILLIAALALTSTAPTADAFSLLGKEIKSWRDVTRAISGSDDKILKTGQAPGKVKLEKKYNVDVNDRNLTSSEERKFAQAAANIQEIENRLAGTSGYKRRWSHEDIQALTKFDRISSAEQLKLKKGNFLSPKRQVEIVEAMRTKWANDRRKVVRGQARITQGGGGVYVVDVSSNGGSRQYGSDGSCYGQCGDN